MVTRSWRFSRDRIVRDRLLAFEIVVEAYIYLYPLVLMDVTRRQATNVATADEAPGRSPMNGFAHVRTFPQGHFDGVARANLDTLYSFAWVDVRNEPVVLSVPDAGNRYYLLPLYDMWSDVFAAPGTPTTGNAAAEFALATRDWDLPLPPRVRRIDVATPYAWIVGRTQCGGERDYAFVNRFQDGLRLTPLSTWGCRHAQPRGAVDPFVDGQTPSPKQVELMSAPEFFSYGAALMKLHPPHAQDHAVLSRIERIGIVAGQDFVAAAAPRVVRDVQGPAVAEARLRLDERAKVGGWTRHGWQLNTETMGAWGTDYLKRATIDRIGLSANPPEDAVAPVAFTDGEGRPLDGAHRYRLRFERDELPPVRAFWSLTLYDDDGFVCPNELDRYSLRSRDPLAYQADGSLELAIQHTRPAGELEPNWLPAPDRPFHLCLRLYWAKEEVLRGSWMPPPVCRVD